MDLEVFAFDKRSIFVQDRCVCSTIILRHGIVNGILGEFGVELTWFAVETEPSEVVYPVGQVRGLLDFCKQKSRVHRKW